MHMQNYHSLDLSTNHGLEKKIEINFEIYLECYKISGWFKSYLVIILQYYNAKVFYLLTKYYILDGTWICSCLLYVKKE